MKNRHLIISLSVLLIASSGSGQLPEPCEGKNNETVMVNFIAPNCHHCDVAITVNYCWDCNDPNYPIYILLADGIDQVIQFLNCWYECDPSVSFYDALSYTWDAIVDKILDDMRIKAKSCICIPGQIKEIWFYDQILDAFSEPGHYPYKKYCYRFEEVICVEGKSWERTGNTRYDEKCYDQYGIPWTKCPETAPPCRWEQ
jgi:hypothetical protein